VLARTPVRRGREMIDLLAVEQPKPKPAVSYEAAIDHVQTHAVVFFDPNPTSTQ
jgi:hypothetical protein